MRQHSIKSDCDMIHTDTGLVSDSLIYSATEIGPVATILEIRCLRMDVFDSSLRMEEFEQERFPHMVHSTTTDRTVSLLCSSFVLCRTKKINNKHIL